MGYHIINRNSFYMTKPAVNNIKIYTKQNFPKLPLALSNNILVLTKFTKSG